MYNLMLGQEEQFEDILTLCEKFYSETPYANKVEWNEDSAAKHIFNIMDSGFFILAYHEEAPVALIGCMVSPFYANHTKNACAEMMWYVHPKHRGTALAMKLVQEAEMLAKDEDCVIMSMSSLSTTPPGVERFYGRLGYAPVEHSYVKEL